MTVSLRSVAGVTVAAFIIAGAAGWITNLPKPQASAADGSSVDGGGAPSAAAAPAAPAGALDQGGAVEPVATDGRRSNTDGMVAVGWLSSTAARTGIPARALQAYAAAAITEAKAAPGCGITWNTLAAIGAIESGHGTHGGAHIDPSGHVVGTILGPRLDGVDFAAVPDTDHGALDGDPLWDRAVGPMQFIPATWAQYGTDADGDGVADPEQIDDAALTAAVYLCAAGGDLRSAAGWTTAIRAYNHDDSYVASVREQANVYARGAS
ncbi:lytic transglycosylase domain-containing protein [Leifsonia aquatica]|uniref:lytic transglycosylase domain-containing protein n=1 Tax=Leifsonia aquatica TaxID=144185 RepID=UPI00046A5174|nr:lytic transglycosylase domain-containing protein [Leifsonia aquatica]